jgi:anti-sigma regulatory factor (Ser/Thr protein kinase)
MVFGGLEQFFRFSHGDLKLQIRRQELGLIVVEALANAADHGNLNDPAKTIRFGMWLGSGGVVFGIQDEGHFCQTDYARCMISARRVIPSTRKPAPSGVGMSIIYESDGVEIVGNALFILLKAESFLTS